MTTELSAAERAIVHRFDMAEPAPESAVERVALAIYNEGAYCGDCPYDGWDACSECRRYVRGYAKAAFRTLSGPSTHDHPASGHPGTPRADSDGTGELGAS